MAEGTTNGRMTWREVNDLLEKRDAKMDERLERIEAKLEPLPALCQKIDRNEKDIRDNKDDIKAINRRSNLWDGLNSLGVMISAAISAALGR